MKKIIRSWLILKLFNNYERGLINSALNTYVQRLGNTLNETVREDRDNAFMLQCLFRCNSRLEPFPLNDLETDFLVIDSRNKLMHKHTKEIEELKETSNKTINDLKLELLWLNKDNL